MAEFARGEDPASLTARADRALYASKQAGRNQVTIDRKRITPKGAVAFAGFRPHRKKSKPHQANDWLTLG